jgi:serine/threonine protein kinase/WD40 repeat protein
MPLACGAKLGPYEIQSMLGAGGMGEVYRARDTRLGRDVAIKVLPDDLACTPDRKARFEREARAISALSHPHICHLYDIGSQDGTEYLVMELLEGETLSRRLEKGPLPLAQALQCGIEIADALEKAHKHGIVHRDLKPGNIMLTKSGAKLLDFGLAKPAQGPAAMASGSNETLSRPLTGEGKIVGTYQYMAPEQIHGENTDARTDIFALGMALYEMITGKRAFQGKSQISVMSAILEKDPEPINAAQPLSPPALEHTIRRALEKDPDRRWQSAADLAGELKWIAEGGSQAGAAAVPITRRRYSTWILGAIAALALLLAAITFSYWRSASTPRLVWKSQLLPPEQQGFDVPGLGGGHMVLSPDGRKLAFVASSSKEQQLWVRFLDQTTAQPLPGTEDAIYPFWSPDSRYIGFFAGGKMKKVPVAGGPVEIICDATTGRGGSWNSAGDIIFAPGPNTPLFVVSASGGTPRPVTQFDNSRAELSHRYPWFLPDGRHFLFTARSFVNSTHSICVGSLDSAEHKIIAPVNSNAVFVLPDSLLFVRDGTLVAQHFNPRRLELEGEAAPVVDKLSYDRTFSKGDFTLSSTGVLAYKQGSSSGYNQLFWYDRSGKKLNDATVSSSTDDPVLSPDGKVLAFTANDQGGATIWLLDLVRNVKTRFSFTNPWSQAPLWSPDGKQIVFGVNSGTSQLYIKPADGSQPEQVLAMGGPANSFLRGPLAWSRDGRYLLYREGKSGLPEISALPMVGDRKPFPVVQAPSFHVPWADFSPDGKWIVYQSDESGRYQIYVAPFPGPGSRWLVSTDGGAQPLWRGSEVFFWNQGDLQVVEVHPLGSGLQVNTPHTLFSLPLRMGQTRREYDVTRDGKRFIINVPTHPQSNEPITLVVNWPSELKKP